MKPVSLYILISTTLLVLGSLNLAQAAAPSTAASAEMSSFEGLVESERQTVMAAQVSGAVTEIAVKVGQSVRSGQVLMRLDARSANQSAVASEAQVVAAQASMDVARKELERQEQLFAQDYISQAALERAQAHFKSVEAQAHAQTAMAGAARTQSDFYVIRAPYAGVISEVSVMLGDMAMPGRTLITLFDPARLRVTATVPQSALDRSQAPNRGLTLKEVKIELPGQPANLQWVTPSAIEVLPTVDAGTHTLEVRLMFPAGLASVTPGMFARAWLPSSEKLPHSVQVPMTAIVHHAEMTGAYVLDGKGQPLLRQVRLGRVLGDQVEVLSGINAGELVVQDAAALFAAPH
jgi:RND family efflux transporter MFP subunit